MASLINVIIRLETFLDEFGRLIKKVCDAYLYRKQNRPNF